MSKLPTTTKTELVNLASLVWHPLLEGIPLMADIGQSRPRGANVKDMDAERSRELTEEAEETNEVWKAFQIDVAANLAENITICDGPNGQLYVVDGRDRVTALRLGGIATAPANRVSPEDAERIIRSKTLRKHLNKGARAYMAALFNPSLAEVKPGKSKSASGNLNAPQAHLGENAEERVPESHVMLASQWGFGRKLVAQAYEVIAEIQHERELMAEDAGYQPSTHPDEWVVKIFAGTGLGAIKAGIASVRAYALGKQAPPAAEDANEAKLLKGFERLKTAVGTIFSQAQNFHKLDGKQRKEIKEALESGLSKAHASFKAMLAKCLDTEAA